MARTRVWILRPVVIPLGILTRPFAGWLPWFGVLTYRGRKSGHVYHTPINVFRRGDRYVFFLTYGSDVEWVKNIRTEGECWLRTRGRDIHLVEPELIVDPSRHLVPPIVRLAGRIVGVSEFLMMRAA